MTQLFSYPGDYVAEAPTIERIAETIDKFAEDALGVSQTSICADRMATVCLGTPIQVAAGNCRRDETARLVHVLEQGVQDLLDSIPPPQPRPVDARKKTKEVA